MPNLGPDLVSEEGLRELLGLGHHAVVVCSKEPARKVNVWYGLWHILCVSPDGRTERILVSSRRDADGADRPRPFKTANGLLSFLHSLGLRTLTVPMEPGSRAGHDLAHHGQRAL